VNTLTDTPIRVIDFCIMCGAKFPSAETADFHNWLRPDENGRLDGDWDPTTKTLTTPMGVTCYLPD
jgi:hypothetical protein